MKIWIVRLFDFAVVGTVGMIIDFGITWILRDMMKLNEYVSNAIGFSAAVVCNFLLNKYWTFHDLRTLSILQFSKYLIISLFGLLLNSIFLYILHKNWRNPFYLAKLMATALVFLWNFTINSLITFR